MKKKHPFLYNVIRRSIVVILLAMMVLTAYNQSTGSLVSPEGFLAKIITPVQGFVSQASQNISSYLYRVKLTNTISSRRKTTSLRCAASYTRSLSRKTRSFAPCLANMRHVRR